MNATSETFTTECMTCGTVKHTEGPWNNSVVYCDSCNPANSDTADTARIESLYAEITRLNDLRNEGRLLAGLGVYTWDRKRGSQTEAKATADLRNLYKDLSMEDMIALRAHQANL